LGIGSRSSTVSSNNLRIRAKWSGRSASGIAPGTHASGMGMLVSVVVMITILVNR